MSEYPHHLEGRLMLRSSILLVVGLAFCLFLPPTDASGAGEEVILDDPFEAAELPPQNHPDVVKKPSFLKSVFQKVFGAPAQPQEAVLIDDLVINERAVAQVKGRPWGPEQVIGPPDTPGAGDIQTAWASLTQDTQEEWLELTYEVAVIPTQVEIHETFNPGAVHKISLFTNDQMEHVVWKGEDPTPQLAPRGVSKIELETHLKVNRVRIYLDSKNVKGWNEIDAVGLIGKGIEETQWAIDAKASSTFAAQAFGINQLIVPQQVTIPRGEQQLLKNREKQMARLVKKLRTKSEQLDHLAKELEKSRQIIEQLEKENSRLKKQLQ